MMNFKQELLKTSQLRVGSVITKQLDTTELLCAAVLATLADQDDVVELMFDRHTAREMKGAQRSSIGLNSQEATFVLASVATKRTSKLAEALVLCASSVLAKIEGKLLSTLQEDAARDKWSLPLVKIAILTSFMFSDFDEDRVSSILGCFVDGDRRRCDDMHAEGISLQPDVASKTVECVVGAFL